MENRDSKIISNTKIWGITVCYAIMPYFIWYVVRTLNKGNDFSINSFEVYTSDYGTRFYLLILPIIVISLIWIIGIAVDFCIDNWMIVVASIEMMIVALFGAVSFCIPAPMEKHIIIGLGVLAYGAIYILLFIYVIRTYIKKHK
ncbi:MAG: hypothetical protein J6Y82_09355 [Bacteroidales bacterium]|nr:hypothetical protein [Bacteroidales bacterium]